MKLFHGTNNKQSIIKNGFNPHHKFNGHHFGNGIYLTDNKNEALNYGQELIECEIEDNLLLEFRNMRELNDFEIRLLFNGKNFETGFDNNQIGFILNQSDGNKLVFIPFKNRKYINILKVE